MEEETIEIYKDVLCGKKKSFPYEFFDFGGLVRFCICIKYLIENYCSFDNLEEIYRFFDSKKGIIFLCNYGLQTPANAFSDCMLDVVKCMTQDDPDSELIYNFLLFERALGVGNENSKKDEINERSKQYRKKKEEEKKKQ